MKQHLTEIEALLRKYEHVYQANLAMTARDAEEREAGAGLRQLDSDEWWGDSDSVAAVDLAITGGFTPEARRDAATFRKLLTELYQVMVDHDLHNEKGEIMAAQFKKWLVSQV
jgi:hypothetical protein